MTARIFDLATLGAALGTALVGGSFFAFSTFVMRALAQLPAPQGIAAMQSINVEAINRWFMGAIFGTALLCLVLGVMCLLDGDAPGARLRLAGCAVYVIGSVIVTIAFNVPRNDVLAALVPDAAEAATAWTTYVREWTHWNHVRTAAALVASTLLMLGR
jgi:uncharacterized membrane protein